MIRRAILAVVARYCFNSAWLQMSLQLELTVLQLAYLIYFKPFDGSFAQNIEEFNEWCTLFIITTLFCMTEFVP